MLRCLFFNCKRCTAILKLDCSWRHDRITELPLPYLARALSFNFTLATCTSYILIMTCLHSLWAATNWAWCANPDCSCWVAGMRFTNQQHPESIHFPPGEFPLRSFHHSKLEQLALSHVPAGRVTEEVTWLLNHWPAFLWPLYLGSLTFVSLKTHELWAC